MTKEITVTDQLSDIVAATSIEELEAQMLQGEQVTCAVSHLFVPGMCVREVRIPAGTMAIGHMQKFDHLNYFLQGRVLMFRDDGSQYEMQAPQVFMAPPGRKMGYIIEDMVWHNVFVTDLTTADEIEAHFLDKSPAFKEHSEAAFQMEKMQRGVDRADYLNVLAIVGFTEDEVRCASETPLDQVPFPEGVETFRISDSAIHGQGLFSTAPIKAGSVFVRGRINKFRTPALRWANHSAQPNAKPVIRDGESQDIDFVALRDIDGSKGGSKGEEITIDYRELLRISGFEI